MRRLWGVAATIAAMAACREPDPQPCVWPEVASPLDGDLDEGKSCGRWQIDVDQDVDVFVVSSTTSATCSMTRDPGIGVAADAETGNDSGLVTFTFHLVGSFPSEDQDVAVACTDGTSFYARFDVVGG